MASSRARFELMDSMAKMGPSTTCHIMRRQMCTCGPSHWKYFSCFVQLPIICPPPLRFRYISSLFKRTAHLELNHRLPYFSLALKCTYCKQFIIKAAEPRSQYTEGTDNAFIWLLTPCITTHVFYLCVFLYLFYLRTRSYRISYFCFIWYGRKIQLINCSLLYCTFTLVY